MENKELTGRVKVKGKKNEKGRKNKDRQEVRWRKRG